jgi:hypothetical protein
MRTKIDMEMKNLSAFAPELRAKRRRTMRYLKVVLTPCVLVTMLMLPASVLAIPCNTGVTGAALTCGIPLLNAGDSDSHWGVVYAGASAPVIAAPPVAVYPSAFANRNSLTWLDQGPGSLYPDSKWITPSLLADHEEMGGQYVYQTEFTGNAPFGGRYSSDNELYKVFLNGMLLASFPLNGANEATGFGIWTGFNIAATDGLSLGLNTLDFVVRNRGTSCGVAGLPVGCNTDLNTTVTGFRAEFSAVPDPGTWLLFASGLAGLAACRKPGRYRLGPPPSITF